MEPSNGAETMEALKEQLARVTEERDRLHEENEVLRSRCQKLARASQQSSSAPRTDAAMQTEEEVGLDGPAQSGSTEAVSEATGGRLLPPVVDQMLRSPKDESVQLQGIQALFEQQTQVEGAQGGAPVSAPALQGSLEAAVAIFGNHPGNHLLLLKASQFLSVLLAEPNAQQQLPLAVLFQAAQSVMAVSIQVLADVASAGSADGLAASQTAKAGAPPPSPSKLLTWFLSLLSLLFPCLGQQLRDRRRGGEALVQDLLCHLVSRLLASPDLAQEALILKCVQLLPLLPMEPWIQKAFLESGAIHALAMVYHRSSPTAGGGGVATEAALPKAIHAAVRGAFADNLELCVKAIEDTFVGDEFICLEVLEELRGMEQKQRGTFRSLDSDWGITGKALGLWNFHQRKALEDQDPQKSPSRDVLQKVSELLSAVLYKLPPQVLLLRMQEFESVEVLQRIALATVHANAQLRLQVAVNYTENNVIPVVIGCMQMFLRHYEGSAPVPGPPAEDIKAAFTLLRDEQLPAAAWPYVHYCLEVCLHVLSHWSATKLSLKQKADVLDSRAAPLLLAQGGLVDSLAELIDPAAAGFELHERPPTEVLQKATETLQALFEQNGHICLFCIHHYSEVKQMVALGCDSLAMDPLTEFPDMQQQAVGQLASSFERFSARDERLGRKILKALTVLFESSYHLVAWFLREQPLSALGELQSLDVHVEAVRAVSRAPYWSAEDAPLLPDFVGLIGNLLLASIQGHGDESQHQRPSGRIIDLTEAEEVVAACMSSVLHLLLIDPSPPTVLHCLARSLKEADGDTAGQAGESDNDASSSSERAVNAVMRVMQVFPSSDRVQMNCQHLLTSLLGE